MRDIDMIFESTIPTIFAGDLNAKHYSWNSRVNNSRGTDLYNHCLNATYIVTAPTESTHCHASGLYQPDFLDIAITNRLTHSIYATTVVELSSDHHPVILTIGDNVVYE
jgi:endonuclease/exonuclease/phosphatase family metal-dependent hydrolase